MSTRPGDQTQTAAELETEWKTSARWNGVQRDYTAEDVIALRGSVAEEHTLAKRGAEAHATTGDAQAAWIFAGSFPAESLPNNVRVIAEHSPEADAHVPGAIRSRTTC